MKIKEDLTNKIFSRLTVQSRDLSKIGLESGSFWLCECSCGTVRSVSRQGLVNHGTKSCGCLQKDRAKLVFSLATEIQAAKNYWFSKYKTRARKLKIVFEFEEESFHAVCLKNCFYCNESPPIRIYTLDKTRFKEPYAANGIDRVNPELGYTKLNCVPCCTTCNLMKTNKNQKDFIEKAIQIADLHRSKNVAQKS